MRISRYIWIPGAILIAYNLFCVAFQPGSQSFTTATSDILPIATSILATIGVCTAFRSFKSWDGAKIAWLLVLVGVISYAIAEALYGFQELVLGIDMDVYYPNLPDIFWIFGYLPFLAGLVLFIVSYRKSGFSLGNWRLVLIPMAMAFAAGIALMMVFVFLPIAADTDIGGLEKFVYYYYPASDLVILAPALVMVYITSRFGKGTLARPWLCVAAGLIFFSASDIAYSLVSWQGLYEGGGLMDVGWNLAYISLGLGGAFQHDIMASFGKGA